LEQKSIKDLGEFGLIEELTQEFSNSHPNTIIGVGDDAAVIKRGDKAVVISTDMLVEGIHFDMMYNPLMHLGYKAVVVNLSDIYAMNDRRRYHIIPQGYGHQCDGIWRS